MKNNEMENKNIIDVPAEEQHDVVQPEDNETPENDTPVVEVKEDLVEKFVKNRHERRVKRAEKKALKAAKPKMDPKAKRAAIVGGVALGVGIAGKLALGVLMNRANSDENCDPDSTDIPDETGLDECNSGTEIDNSTEA